jgi:hypothetical protein
MLYGDGSVYAGMWQGNLFHGIGTYINISDGSTYVGEWAHGVKEGEVRMRLNIWIWLSFGV